MKIGYCLPPKTASLGAAQLWQLVSNCGYDYIECAAGHMLALSEGELDELCRLRAENGLKIRAVNCLIPAQMKLCGAVRSPASELRGYLTGLCARMHKLGAGIAVFGSGAARALPDGMAADDGKTQLRDFLLICAEAGEKYEVTTVVEPLNRCETNMINSLAEGAELVSGLAEPRIRLLADSYHMSEEGEDADIGKYLPLLAHAHIAEADSRMRPGYSGGEYVSAFLSALKAGGYAGGVSVECKSDDPFADLVPVMDFLKTHIL